MTTADVPHAGGPPGGDHAREMGPRSLVPPSSPALASAWLLRTAAWTAVVAGIMGVIVSPGLRGNAADAIVLAADRITATFAVLLFGALVALILGGGLELLRARDVPMGPRAALIGGGAMVLAMSVTGVRDRVPPFLALVIAAIASVCGLVGAYCAARGPHTRACAGVLTAFAFATIARLGAWELAMRAGDQASMQLFGWSRTIAACAVFFEAAGQLMAVTWLGTRGRLTGQLACCAALVVAFALTLGVAHGVHSGAPLWEAVLHTALADAPGIPSPYGVSGLATFLIPASLLLALVAAAQPRQVAAVVATMALALISRGAFDAPLRGLCAVAAAQWAALACVDERAMWRTLLDDRNRRVREGDREAGSPRPAPPPRG